MIQAATRRRRPFKMQKIEQLVRLVRESHENPMTGESRLPEIVADGETGVTFLGHSSFLLQMGGKNILVDPVFSTRLIVLRRQRRPGVLVRDLPPIDLVLITHAHMDHLDKASLRGVISATRRLRGTSPESGPEIVIPHGVEDLVDWMGFARVHALSWWQEIEVQGLRIVMTPCKHWGARMFRDMHREYGGYFIAAATGGPTLYHSGDTAYFEGFAEVGARLAPDIALLPIGAYFPDTYRSVHTSPEEAVRGFIECGAKWMVPMHFGTFRLGREPMEEPVQRLNADARRLGIEDKVRVLSEGETMKLSSTGSILPSRTGGVSVESPSLFAASYGHG